MTTSVRPVPVFGPGRVAGGGALSTTIETTAGLASAAEIEWRSMRRGILFGFAGALICWLLIGLAIWAAMS